MLQRAHGYEFDASDDGSRAAFHESFTNKAGVDVHGAPGREIEVAFGRTLHVRKAADGTCHFNFDELCRTDVGPADYQALCREFVRAGTSAFRAALHI